MILFLRRQIAYRTAKTEKEIIALEDGADFWKQTGLNVTRCSVCILTTSIGAAIGTIVSPGKGTMTGALLGELVPCIY